MSVDKRLEEQNEEIDNVLESLDRMYEQGLPESETELLWRELEYLYAERKVLRARFSGEPIPLELAVHVLAVSLTRVWNEFASKLVSAFQEIAQALKPIADKLTELADQMRRPTKLPSYRLAFSSEAAEIAPGQLSRIEARGQAPPNRRPTLRGFQRQKGRG